MKIVEQSSSSLSCSLIRADGRVRNLASGAWEEASATPTPDQCLPFNQPAGGLWQPFLVADILGADGFDLADDARCYGCFRLGGQESHAIQDASQCISATKKFTWACWLKAGTPPAGPNAPFIGESNPNSSTPFFLIGSGVSDPAVLRFSFRDDANLSAEATGKVRVADGGWHHVAVSSDGTNASLYVDGHLDAATPLSSVGKITTGVLAFGGLLRPTGNMWWAGSLDDVRAYRRPLSADEIASAATRWLAGPTGNGDISVVIWELDPNGVPAAIHRIIPLGWVVAANPRPGGSA